MNNLKEYIIEKFSINKDTEFRNPAFKQGERFSGFYIENVNNSNEITLSILYPYDFNCVKDDTDNNEIKWKDWSGKEYDSSKYIVTKNNSYQCLTKEYDTTKNKKAKSYKHIKSIMVFMRFEETLNLIKYIKNNILKSKYLIDNGYINDDWILKYNITIDEKSVENAYKSISNMVEKNNKEETIKRENLNKAKEYAKKNFSNINSEDLIIAIYKKLEYAHPSYRKIDDLWEDFEREMDWIKKFL